MRVLFINVENKESKVKIIDDPRINGVLDLGIYLHLYEYKSYSKDIYDKDNVVVFGGGYTNYRGGFRAAFVFRSPLHGRLHSSTIGDLAEYLKRAGYDAVVFEGKSDEEVFVIIDEKNVLFMKENIPESIFGKSKELYEKLKDIYDNKKFRIALVGLASKNTDYGSIVSPRPDRLEIVDIAGRGGAGSVLYKAHNIVGFAIGGNKQFEEKQYNIRQVIEGTKKYREKGTFYGNYPHLQDKVPILNWLIFYLDKNERLEFYKKFIENELIKDYKFQTDTCGERCVAACKKVENGVKLDYEPVNGLGPFIGIFRRDLVRELVKLVDDYGFDSIYLGYVLGIIMEGIEKGILDLNVSEKPILNPDKWDKDYSEINYKVAKKLIEDIANGKLIDFGKRIREIVKKYPNLKDIAFYVPIGEYYDMTPNFYWTLGLILPIVMHGKYFSDYHTIFKDPKSYGKYCGERTIKEYIMDNLGVCRFHRAWFENLIDESMIDSARYWIKKLIEYSKLANAEPRIWESKRVYDTINKLAEELGNKEVNWEEYWKKWYEAYLKSFE